MNRLALLLTAAMFTVPALAAQTGNSAVEISGEPHHHLILENEFVRVYYVEVPAHTDTLMHWHHHDYIFVTLGATEVVNAVEGKPPVTLKLQDGETRFSPAPFAHVARNLMDQPSRNVTIELVQDDKLRRSTSAWDADLETLRGGTAAILFVKDDVRATQFELKPGEVVPMRHHAGPHLLVAVSDLDIRSDQKSDAPTGPQGSLPQDFKPGMVKWLPGGYSYTVTNTGQQPAKFITLEFP